MDADRPRPVYWETGSSSAAIDFKRTFLTDWQLIFGFRETERTEAVQSSLISDVGFNECWKNYWYLMNFKLQQQDL